MEVPYRHTQFGWVTVAGITLVGGLITPLLFAVEGSAWAGWFTAVILLATLLLFATLRLDVDAESIRATFGVGVIRKRVALSDVRWYGPVQNAALWGWGIRHFPGGILYNVSGLSAVELVLRDGHRIRFGTDEPEEVCRALAQTAGPREPMSAGEELVIRKRARRGTVWFALGTFVFFALLATYFRAQLSPPRVEVSDDRLLVKSAAYSDDVPLADVRGVSLKPEIPEVLRRTNGFALGGTLRGHFRVRGLGDGKLYIDRDRPPFVVVKTSASYVIVNFDDSERTRTLYRQLERARNDGNGR